MAHYQGVAQPGSAPGLEPGGRRFESCRPDHPASRYALRRISATREAGCPPKPWRRRAKPNPNHRWVPCDATTSTNCRPFETSRKRRRGLCLRNAGAARRARRARRQGVEREARAQRPVPVRLGTALSRNAACAPAASTAAGGIITSAINSRGGPRPVASLGSGAIGGAADSDSAGCRFDPCLPNHPASRCALCRMPSEALAEEGSPTILAPGELAERQGIAVLTRRDRKVGQVRLLHSPPNSPSWHA
jgi:hypothetical protein